MKAEQLRIAMLSIHSCPVGELGTKDTGGMSVYVRELARALGKHGHIVDIYTRYHDPRDSQIVELGQNTRLIHLKAGDDGEMHKLTIYPHLEDFACALEDFRRRNSIKYDVVHSHYWLSGLVGRWVQRWWNIPHVLMFHTLGAVKNAIGVGEDEPELRVVTEKELAEDCHRIIAATEGEKEQLASYCGASQETVAVIPCGVNLDMFKPVDKQSARQELGFEDDRIVLYVGRIEPLKGLDRLLLAVSHLRDRQRLRLVIIGGDSESQPELQRLQGLSRELGIQDFVTFAGRIEHEYLPCYYSAADVFVMPSHYESFGLVALESLACGTPVVANKVGGVDGLIREGETGYVVNDDAPVSLAEKVGMVLLNTDIDKKSLEVTRASVSGFSWSNVAGAMAQEYKSLIGN